LESLLLAEDLCGREPLVLEEEGVELSGGKEAPRVDDDHKLRSRPPLLLLTGARGSSSTIGTIRRLGFEEDIVVRGRRQE